MNRRLIYLILAVIVLGGIWLIGNTLQASASEKEDDDLKRIDHKITLSEAVEYQRRYLELWESGKIILPETGWVYDLKQIKKLAEQEGGEDFVSALGVDKDNKLVLILYVVDANGDLLKLILERGTCCPKFIAELRVAQS